MTLALKLAQEFHQGNIFYQRIEIYRILLKIYLLQTY
jgi:hypothetical protein